jgi:hypothetical protein
LDIEILGTESLGVRGLSCFIRACGRNILIDPGLAKGFTRYGLHPHPIQAIMGERIKHEIVERWDKNPMLKPKIAKVTVNISVGSATERLSNAIKVIEQLTGQKPVPRRARRTIKDQERQAHK